MNSSLFMNIFNLIILNLLYYSLIVKIEYLKLILILYSENLYQDIRNKLLKEENTLISYFIKINTLRYESIYIFF